MKDLIIAGAGGFGREALLLAKTLNDIEPRWNIRGFINDIPDALDGIKCTHGIIGTIKDWQPSDNEVFVMGISSPEGKKKVADILKAKGARFETLVHPYAIVSDYVTLGEGCIINGRSSIGDNAVLGDFVNLAGSMVGQDAVIVDDIRASDFKFNEFLKITDNHMSAMVSARYHNIDLNCKCMYLTSVVPLSEFYENLRKENDEASEQITGRIGMLIEVDKKTFDISVYNDETMTYEKIARGLPNPILTDKDIQRMNVNERKKMAVNMFKGIADLSDYTADYVDKHQMSLTDDFMPVPDDDPFED